MRRMLREVDREIAAHTRRRDRLLDDLATAGGDHQRIVRLGRDLAAVELELAAAEERWLELGEALESG